MTRNLTFYHFFITTQVTPLQPKTSNKTTRKKLKPFPCEVIVGRYHDGHNKVYIQRVMGLSYLIINITIEIYQTSITGTSSPHSGMPEILSDTYKQYIYFQTKQDPLMKTENICKSLDKPVSACTVAHALKKCEHTSCKAQKRLN